ncbi:PIG-L family deacetylase [Streptomyces diastatochromogenes]|nr:PIG-L family deacetylase [Streptomyces diastatochromogenes]
MRRPALPSRRRTAATVVTAALVGGACVGFLTVSGASNAPAAHAAAGSSAKAPESHPPVKALPAEAHGKPATGGGSPVSVVQIVAHPDDDLFFMNPDVSQSLRSGSPLTGVYLTAGESDGINSRPRDRRLVAPDKAGYAEARQNGIRAAYAEMATGSRTSAWDREAIPTAGGGWAELDTLRDRPQIKLMWLQIREAGSINGDRPHSLHGLWNGRITTLESQRSSGTPVAADFAYTKEQVVATLTGILERFRPTFVRMQDPSPGTYPKTGALRDHQDHLYGARFAQAALARYAELPGHPHVSVQNYLGYPTSALPHTLDPAAAETKLRSLKTYSWLDGVHDCEADAGCGDLKVSVRPTGRGWTKTVRYARGTSTSWVQRDPRGGLHAFSVLDGHLATWRKPAGSLDWKGPELLPGGGIDSGVTSVTLPGGRTAVYGTRTVLGTTAADYRREVVTTVQSVPGGAFGPWRSSAPPSGTTPPAPRTSAPLP